MQHQTFKLQDLPTYARKSWTTVFVPMFLDYISQHVDPWDSTDFLAAAQRLWDKVYQEHTDYKLAAKGDPVFAVVCVSF